MKKLILILCIAMSGQAYGQYIFDDNFKETTLDLYEDLVYLNDDVLKNGDCNNAYRLNDIAIRVEHIMTLMVTINDLLAIKAGTKSILNKSEAGKVGRDSYNYINDTFVMRTDNLIMKSNTLIKVINNHMTPLLGSGQVIANDLRKHVREIKRRTEKYKDI